MQLNAAPVESCVFVEPQRCAQLASGGSVVAAADEDVGAGCVLDTVEAKHTGS